MANEPEPADVKNIWQSQPVEGTNMSLEEIKRKMDRLQKNTRLRSVGMGLALLLMSTICARLLSKTGNRIEALGATLLIISVAYVGYQLFLLRKKPANMMGENMPPTSVVFYRTELERQRDFHRGLWLWSRLVVTVPGALILLIGQVIEHPERMHPYRLIVILVVGTTLSVARSLWQARKYQREIDGLEMVRQ